MFASCTSPIGSVSAGLPLVEIDRFFAAPADQRCSGVDAQARALDRIIRICNQLRPHLCSVASLETFIGAQRNPGRVRRRIAEALSAGELDGDDCEHTSGNQLEAFRSLVDRKPAALVWVFS